MAQYTVEDIEILRQKSGISYEEAVNLLEYHNGSLARSLVDLEKNGRLRDVGTSPQCTPHGKHHHHTIDSLYQLRVKVFKGNIPIINLSILFLIFALLVAPWLVILSAIAALLMGYRFAVKHDDTAFGEESLEHMVKNAGSNVKGTLFTIARDLGLNNEGKPTGEKAEVPPELEKRSENPASGTTPVSVQFSEDGSVRVTEDAEGYHEADIQ
ncbi:MAG: hypothetical protein LLF96_07545 [Eubacteriales bacterium]|nr:hypothetical protein [Eubacteriales bacterium]